MEIKNKLTVTRGERGTDNGGKRGGSRQGTCRKDPWTWTTGWGLTVAGGLSKSRESNRGKIGTTVVEQ